MKNLRSPRSFARLTAMVAVLVLAYAAPMASAQTSQGGYTPPSSNVQAEIEDSPATGSSSTDPKAGTAADTVKRSSAPDNGALPFTGLDLGFIGIAGVGLLVVGFGLRRLTQREAEAEQGNAA